MVRNDQKFRRVGERLVVGKPGGIGMSVRTDDRQVFYAVIKRPRNTPCRCFRRKQSFVVQTQPAVHCASLRRRIVFVDNRVDDTLQMCAHRISCGIRVPFPDGVKNRMMIVDDGFAPLFAQFFVKKHAHR